MANGLCSRCLTVLTGDNCPPSILKVGRGYCRTCTNTRYGINVKRTCPGCKVSLEKENCQPSVFRRGAGFCRECSNKYSNSRYHENPKRHTETIKRSNKKNWIKSRGYWRKHKFGTTQEQFDAKLISQDGRCEICNCPMTSPFQDHDHKTGKNRDLLCRACNSLLGNAYENEDILTGAILYLRKHADG
jgi:hypothetical protein